MDNRNFNINLYNKLNKYNNLTGKCNHPRSHAFEQQPFAGLHCANPDLPPAT